MRRSLVDRILSRIEQGEGCWLWPGAQTGNGYGIITQHVGNGKYKGYTTHRVLYEYFVGPVPAGLDLDHVKARGCTSRACCNPAHLEPVTRLENSHRGAKYRPAACVHGHAYTEANSYYVPSTGHIRCRECARERQRVKHPAGAAAGV